MTEKASEREIQNACMKWLALKGIFHFRHNNVGIFNPKTKGYFFHGLHGVSDIIGIFTQNHEGARFGCLLAIEVKTPDKNPTPSQQLFLKEVNERGGIGICVHSVEELEEKLNQYEWN